MSLTTKSRSTIKTIEYIALAGMSMTVLVLVSITVWQINMHAGDVPLLLVGVCMTPFLAVVIWAVFLAVVERRKGSSG